MQGGPDAGLRARYTKQEVEIPMRDGVKLFTIVYAPDDTSRAVPILMTRTPYGSDPTAPTRTAARSGPSAAFEKDGYIFVYQDVRGRFRSDGEFVEMRPTQVSPGPTDVDESTDTYDTIDWLLKSDLRHNGRVGLWGISYRRLLRRRRAARRAPGAQGGLAAGADRRPVPRRRLVPQRRLHAGGELQLLHRLLPAPRRPVGEGRPPAVRLTAPRTATRSTSASAALRDGSARRFPPGNTYWEDNLAHPTYDAFWQARAIAPHLRDITPAVLTVGGWFDAEDLAGPLRIYRAIERQSPPRRTAGDGPVGARRLVARRRRQARRARLRREDRRRVPRALELPFFEHHLRDAPLADAPEASVFETGANAWRTPPAWPPADATPRTFYLRGRRGARGRAGADVARARSEGGFDEYVSDPARPVPYVPNPGTGMRRDYMTEDQRFAATRPDVLVYQTPPLAEDLTIAGPIDVALHVSTTGTDADFVVKLIDVYPERLPRRRSRDASGTRGWAAISSWCAASRSAASSATASRSRSRSCPASRRRSRSTCPTSRTRSAAATG